MPGFLGMLRPPSCVAPPPRAFSLILLYVLLFSYIKTKSMTICWALLASHRTGPALRNFDSYIKRTINFTCSFPFTVATCKSTVTNGLTGCFC